MTERSQIPRSQSVRAAVIILLMALCFTAASQAATWRVERDGSGDFTTIQPALDGAAAGDTILIGPGFYTECMMVTLPGWSWPIEVYAYVRRDDLTIIGESPETVIIGPETADFHDFGPKGFVSVQTNDWLFLENLSTRNLYDGIYFYEGQLEVFGRGGPHSLDSSAASLRWTPGT